MVCSEQNYPSTDDGVSIHERKKNDVTLLLPALPVGANTKAPAPPTTPPRIF